MSRDECQEVLDRLARAQYEHQKAGGSDNLYGKAALTILEMSKVVHKDKPCEFRAWPEMRRDSFRVVE